jgi:hypothetical protein
MTGRMSSSVVRRDPEVGCLGNTLVSLVESGKCKIKHLIFQVHSLLPMSERSSAGFSGIVTCAPNIDFPCAPG